MPVSSPPRQLDRERVLHLGHASAVFRLDRRPRTSPDDFGDDASIGLQLKRRDSSGQLAIYLGTHAGEQLVAVRTLQEPGQITHGLAYGSLEDLKHDWSLD